MADSRSRSALMEFLEYLADKGLMNKATVQARKAAASQILGILDETEAHDVTAIDVDDVVERFGRLHSKRYTPQSLTTYKSRLRSALDDFEAYTNNPLGFRPSGQSRERAKPRPGKGTNGSVPPSSSELRSEPTRSTVPPMASGNIVPIPIRADLTIYIQGLPFDLSEAEARKIAAVVTAMAN